MDGYPLRASDPNRDGARMDYTRIYRDFITDRKSKPEPTGYAELHHIVPRSHGGADTRENLILLTAEDHFFAHLLLAKIHGAGMWVAVCRMRWGRVGGERPWVNVRYMYAIAKQKSASLNSARFKGQPGKRGNDNGRYDSAKLLWTNIDTGAQLFATKWEMWVRFAGSRAHWTSASNGARKSMLGWTAQPEKVRVRSFKGKRFSFVNRDGRTFSGTQGEFVRHTGLTVASATRIVRHKSVSRCGWRVEGTEDRRHNSPKNGNRPGPLGQVFVLEKGSERVSGTRIDLAEALNSTPAQISATIFSMRMGKVKTYKGWRLCPA